MSEVQSIQHYTRRSEPDGHKCDCIRVSLQYSSIIYLGPLMYHGLCSSFSGTTALFAMQSIIGTS
jgi:hypothetical protein